MIENNELTNIIVLSLLSVKHIYFLLMKEKCEKYTFFTQLKIIYIDKKLHCKGVTRI